MKRLIQINWDQRAKLLSRPNRFLALARLINADNSEDQVKVHVRDPGRLQELLYPGNDILLRKASSKNRKTQWDLIAARFATEWIMVNSGFHPAIARAILMDREISPFGHVKEIKSEISYGKSRLDFFITNENDEKIFIEIKGCTLAVDNAAIFPDAPTKRGKRHLQELIQITRYGGRGSVFFLIFRENCLFFEPNREMDPEFANTLIFAQKKGVEIYPVLLAYRQDIIWYKQIIPFRLK